MSSIKSLIRKLHWMVVRPRFYKNVFKRYDIQFYDSIFPNPLSGFRLEEFSKYLAHYRNSCIIVQPADYVVLRQTTQDFQKDLMEFREMSSGIAAKIKELRLLNNVNCKLFYCVFYNNVARMLPVIMRHKLPFAFTLYPGGGFNLESQEVRDKLTTICALPFFKGAIVTQKIVREYLLSNKICAENKIHYIFGGIVPQNSLSSIRKYYYNANKESLDICFCANKYMPQGIDKGYDIFVEVAKELAKKYEWVRFSVIGDFSENEIDVSDIGHKIRFYGKVRFEELQSIFLKMDVIISPNRPNALGKGLFDGFPLGTVVEAALNGVIPIATDELGQNDIFEDDEIFIIKPSTEDCLAIIEKIIKEGNFKEKSEKIQMKFRKIYSNDNQLTKRLEVLDGMH